MSYVSELKTDMINNRAPSLEYGTLKTALKLKEIIREDKEVLGKLHEIGCDLGIADKTDGQLSFKQLEFRIAVDKFGHCIECMNELDERLEAASNELRDIFAKCEKALQMAEEYVDRAKDLEKELRVVVIG